MQRKNMYHLVDVKVQVQSLLKLERQCHTIMRFPMVYHMCIRDVLKEKGTLHDVDANVQVYFVPKH